MVPKRRPSDRYVRLCHHNDFELRHALQLLHIDNASFGLPAIYDPPPVHPDHLAPFSVFSPSPAHPASTEKDDAQAVDQHKHQDQAGPSNPPLHINDNDHDSFSLSPAVLNSLVSAAMATREPYVFHSNDGHGGPPSAHSSSSAVAACLSGQPYTAMPAAFAGSSRKPASVTRPPFNSNGSGVGGGADAMDLHESPPPPLPPPPPSAVSPGVSNTHTPAPASTPSISRPQAKLLKKSSFQTARSRLHRSSSSLNRSTTPDGRPPPPQQQQHAPLHSSAITRNLLGTKRLRPLSSSTGGGAASKPQRGATDPDLDPDLPEVPNVDPKLVQLIMNETLDKSPGVEWDDIAGLTFAKQCVMEAVVWPMLRPDIFSGLRGPPKGLLLFGPPGTGKTMIGRAIASKSGARFFNISASSLVSKWAGEGEKTVRALFGVARIFQPSVVFIDEIDSLLTQRSDGEQEYTRRIKTEFLVQMDGAGTSREDRVLVVGATNRPQELDEAARRRLVKRLYIPLPDTEARCCLIKTLMLKQSHGLSDDDVAAIAQLSNGYSGSDMYALCAEAALGPVRDLGDAIRSIEASNVRPVNMSDFRKACRMVRASVSQNDLDGYVEWNESFGSFSMKDHNQQDENGSDARMVKDTD